MTLGGMGDRTYVVGTSLSMTAYAAAILLLSLTPDGLLGGPALYAAALLPSLAIAGQLWVTMSYMRRADEFVRGVMSKRFLAAAMLACIVATTWGFFETFAHARHLPGWLVYPVFWAMFGLTSPFIRTSH